MLAKETPTSSVSAHRDSTVATWLRLQQLKTGQASIILDGNNLDIASIVAVARYGVTAQISKDKELAQRIQHSVEALEAFLSQDYVVYGVNTGFGGSADARTRELLDLQIGLLQHTQSAIIAHSDLDPASNSEREPSHVIPPAWIRGAMVARANQNLRGHSAVRLEVLENLIAMVERGIVPLVPLRGSISASGDLMPMSYIAGALTGNPDVFVQVGHGKSAKVMPAPEALSQTGLSSTGLGPKEGLGLINGTAPSVSAGSVTLHDAQQLAVLAQHMTAFTSECLAGNVEWAHPFVHAIRPHPGQIEAASNIRHALRGSQYVDGLISRRRKGDGLWQDRYSTRTSPQWIGPYLEDLLLAQRQLEVELNSTSDNPLVDIGDTAHGAAPLGEVYSGGNFQAVAITSAMDKTRLALQMIGRMLFSQVSEMISPTTNNGLDANLNSSDKENFTMKGIDVNMASYMSELAALAHPVSSHVMSAEMHNQGINSLALISARKTMEAVDLVRHMCACHVYVSCQAIDLRARHEFVMDLVNIEMFNGIDKCFETETLSEEERTKLFDKIRPVIESTWLHWNAGCWEDRISHVVDAVTAPVTMFLAEERPNASFSQIKDFRERFTASFSKIARDAMDGPLSSTSERMGEGTRPIYTWVRKNLAVPMHRGLEDDPLYNARQGESGKPDVKTIGSWVSRIYESLKGDMMDMVMALD